MNFLFTPLELPGVTVVETRRFEDARGSLTEQYKQSAFAEAGLTDVFVQDNVSRSRHGVVRGLHYQLPPFDQAKLVSVVDGEVFDVAVDVRHGSPTFGRWVGATLSAENRRMLYVPSGYAHGFLVTGPHAIVAYKSSGEYAPSYERGVRWDDPDIGIEWPDPNAERIVSATDRELPGLAAADLPRLEPADRG